MLHYIEVLGTDRYIWVMVNGSGERCVEIYVMYTHVYESLV